MLCKFGLQQITFFSLKTNFLSGIGEKLLQTKAAPVTSFNLSIIRWSLSKTIDIGTKQHVPIASQSNPVQSSRSKSTTCPRNGRLLTFELCKLNNNATSDGGMQKLGNDVRCDSKQIATKVCRQISSK